MECGSNIPIEKIHASSHSIEAVLGEKLLDIVPAYHSIAVFSSLSIAELSDALSKAPLASEVSSVGDEILEIPICYELGLDMDRLVKSSNLTEEQIISIHLSGTYRSLFIGFNPGFIYADGLDDRLSCPRLDNPRMKVPEQSIGIAGTQTGIYSMESPGGWNIIGRTPKKIFDSSREQPMLIGVGTRYKFRRITKKEFEKWEG